MKKNYFFGKFLFAIACLLGFVNADAQLMSNYSLAVVNGDKVVEVLSKFTGEEVTGLVGFDESDDILYTAYVPELKSNFMILQDGTYNVRKNWGGSTTYGADNTAHLNQQFNLTSGTTRPVLLESTIYNAVVKFYYYNMVLVIEQGSAPETTVTLDQVRLDMHVGEEVTLNATVTPQSAVTWSTNAKAVATVDENGKVTAVGEGTALITAASADGVKASCSVTVTTATEITFFENMPQAVEDVDLWSTSYDTQFDVFSTNDVKGFRFKSQADGYIYTSKLDIPAAGNVYFSFNLGRKDQSDQSVLYAVYIGKDKQDLKQKMEGEYRPAYGWTSPAPTGGADVTAFVSEAGTYYIGIKFLETITDDDYYMICNATARWEKSDSPEVRVVLDNNTLMLETGEEATLTATVIPSDFAQYVKWESSDETVATVVNGKVKALAPGTAIISAKCDDAVATCDVVVTNPPLSITLNQETAKVDVGKTVTLKATVVPDADAVVTWTSADDKIATVDNGVVEGVSAGTVIITASYKDVSAECTVIVAESGVETIFADGAVFDVYSVDGVVLLRNADAEAFRALGAGLYIVNGQKVLVK